MHMEKKKGEEYEFSAYGESRGMYSRVWLNCQNWSYNIMREVIPTVFDRGIEDIVVCPVSITPNQAKS